MSYPYGQQPGHPTQQPYPPHYGNGYPPPRPPKKSSAGSVLFCIGAVVLVLFGGCAALVVAVGSENTPTTAATTTAAGQKGPEESEAKPARLGSVVRDGKFAFKVTKLSRTEKVGGPYLNVRAQGRFLLVHITVENIGDEAQAFTGDAQRLYDSKGREHEASSEAAVYLDDSKSLYEKINPGNSVEGVVLFDIPKSVEPARIELHDSIFSEGATVDLR